MSAKSQYSEKKHNSENSIKSRNIFKLRILDDLSIERSILSLCSNSCF